MKMGASPADVVSWGESIKSEVIICSGETWKNMEKLFIHMIDFRICLLQKGHNFFQILTIILHDIK